MIVAFSVAPSGGPQPGDSVSDAVAEAVKVVRASGLPNRTSSMFTEIAALGQGSFPVIRPCSRKQDSE